MNLSFYGKLKMEGGKFIHPKNSDVTRYELYKKEIPEGCLVEIYYQVLTPDGTLAQLAKVHACIRELALHIGYTFTEMKHLVKDESGLCLKPGVPGKEKPVYRSFSDCSTDELSLAIRACQQIAEFVNLPMQ